MEHGWFVLAILCKFLQFVEHLHLCPFFKAIIVEMQISEF